MKYYHVDVFSKGALSGNGLTVIICDESLSSETMQAIACEFKQFETIFLIEKEGTYKARIFTVEEELDFAGHPILGLGAIIHKVFKLEVEKVMMEITLNKKSVTVTSLDQGDHYTVSMNQGKAEWGNEISKEWQRRFCEALNISEQALSKEYPMEVVSTGLPYLLVPIQKDLDQVKISTTELEEMLAHHGAKFVYIFDLGKMEGRTWDNLGKVEDVATGSAAGPMGAYLYKHGYCRKNEEIILHQGRFVGRPSEIIVSNNKNEELIVAGDVKILVSGTLELC